MGAGVSVSLKFRVVMHRASLTQVTFPPDVGVGLRSRPAEGGEAPACPSCLKLRRKKTTRRLLALSKR